MGIPASKGLADISMHGVEAETAEAKRIIEVEERLERGDAHCFVVMAKPTEGAQSGPERERTVTLVKREGLIYSREASRIGRVASQCQDSPPEVLPGRRLG